MIQSLTPKEKGVLEFISEYMKSQGLAPSYTEIKEHFGFASFNSVQKYLKQLQGKGYIHIPGGNQKRAIQVLKPASSLQSNIIDLETNATNKLFVDSFKKGAPLTMPAKHSSTELLSLPLLGEVAAGQPLEAYHHDSSVEVPSSMLKLPSKSFALTVVGYSMIEDGIFDGDTVLIQEQKTAENGQLVVASVEGSATLKHFYFHKDQLKPVELRPANEKLKPMWFSPHEVEIRGIVIGLIRKYI